MIISKTPLRMSFVGGGSDLRAYYQHGYGAVVSTAIDKYIYITVNKRFTDHLRIGYSQIEYVNTIDDIKHNLVKESLKLVGITKGIEVVYMSDMLPAHEGSGLGASSSILVGTLHALHAFKGEYVSAKTLAEEACKIEIDVLGHPIGKQDQYAAAYGGFNFYQFNKDESVIVDPLIFSRKLKDELNDNLLLFYTGLTARSDTILTEQNEKTKDNLHTLNAMVLLAKQLLESLRSNDLTHFGELLHQGWKYKQSLASKVTNSTINNYYERARKAGAVGGKILGSGGGGFLLLYCEKEKQTKVRKTLADLKETPFRFETQGSKIIYVSE
jgi:D-glycero-alpha-D-manno-heptose-7-phosphate kinase